MLFMALAVLTAVPAAAQPVDGTISLVIAGPVLMVTSWRGP